MVSNAIEIKNIEKSYRSGVSKSLVLNDVSFTVKKGEAFGFIQTAWCAM